MAYNCDVCGKGRMMANKISHSNIKTKRVQRPNLQRVRALVEGVVQRMRVCTRCLRTGRIVKAA